MSIMIQDTDGTVLRGDASLPRRRASLRVALLRAISLVLLVTLLVGGLLTYGQAMRKIDTELTSAMAVAENTLAKAMPEIARTENPRQGVKGLVRLFEGHRHVRATLRDKGPPPVLIASTPAHVNDTPAWFARLFEKERLFREVTLPDHLAAAGTLVLETDASAEIAEVWDEVLLKLAILMVFCAVLGTLVYITIGHAIEPITNLQDALVQVGSGDYSARVAEAGPAELADLCAGFNTMAERLENMEMRNLALNEQLSTVQDEERADLARDLHDEVSPFLFSVEVDAASIRALASQHQAESEIATRIDAIRDAVAHMKKHVRAILGRLRSADHLEFGLDGAIEALVKSWRVRKPNITIRHVVSEQGHDRKIDAVIHALVREAISNALKHGKASEIDISVTRAPTGGLLVDVRDNGTGLEAGRQSAGGFGLISMRERIAALGGALVVKNRNDKSGVEIRAEIPPADQKAPTLEAETGV